MLLTFDEMALEKFKSGNNLHLYHGPASTACACRACTYTTGCLPTSSFPQNAQACANVVKRRHEITLAQRLAMLRQRDILLNGRIAPA